MLSPRPLGIDSRERLEVIMRLYIMVGLWYSQVLQ